MKGSGNWIPAYAGMTSAMPFLSCPGVQAAIAREKQLKNWRRSKKIALIESSNPQWKDFSLGWDGMDNKYFRPLAEFILSNAEGLGVTLQDSN